ncbi:MAG TPA: hypothetical protein VE604_11530 [Candidatus Polarisedimenticolia bacterium]|nr:hypothetical protein [Candidatus Polarisedimenticolia bacterium]
MRADHADVSWDAQKSKWLVRISVGEEVIRRHCDLPKNADQKDLRIAAEKTLHDEGYELDAAAITVQQPQAA